MKNDRQLSRRKFVKTTGLAALGASVPSGMIIPTAAQAQSASTDKKDYGGPYNILMIVTDQERHMQPEELPPGFSLPGHDRMTRDGVVFENHQVASCVCTPSRAVMYTGQHI